MKYADFIKEGSTIGLTAPSFGVAISPYNERYENAYKKFTDARYSLAESASVRALVHAQSTTAAKRAQEFMEMYLDNDIDFIWSVAGGERMLEILPYIDFKKISSIKPKYFMGYSDNTCLTFLLTIISDVATIYGPCFPSFGMQEWDKSLIDTYKLMQGKKLSFDNYSFYEDPLEENDSFPLASYNLTKEVRWTANQDNIEMEGRIIGGCLDVLQTIIGTPFDKVTEFTDKYQDDGIIWYLEACDLNAMGILRALWQMKQAGWFKHTKGFIFGRALNNQEVYYMMPNLVVKEVLEDLNVPIIMDADIGHVPPMIPIINGSYVKIKYGDSKGNITMFLK